LGKSDSDLIARAKAGDRASFDLLVREHYALVHNTAHRILGDQLAAEDATQTAFVRAYRSLDRFRGGAAFSTWLYRIVSNVCLDMLRSRKNDTVGLEITHEDDDDTEQRPLRDDTAEPSATIEREERQQIVHRAIAELSDDHRVVLVLCDIMGLSYEEIAEILDMPIGTVKSRLNRARLALKDILAPQLELFT
jgi:RNA polymerase sigma-70 factor (ECF subfamily)